MIVNSAMEYSHGLLEICTRAIMKTTKDTDMDKCTGMMEATTKDNGSEEFNMEKVKFMYLNKVGKKVFSKIMC